MRQLLVRLYPARWRARYGEEFTGLLESTRLGPYDVVDIVLAAIDARLYPRGRGAASHHNRGVAMSLRISGAAAIVGGVLFVLGFAWPSLSPRESGLAIPLVLLAILSLLVGLVGLSAYQARNHPVLVWTAFAIPAVGIVAALTGMVLMGGGGEEGWLLWALGLAGMMIGSFLFGLVTLRTRALPRPAAALLAFGSLGAVLAGTGLAMFGGPTEIVSAASIIAFAAGWIGLGWAAMRVAPSIAPRMA